MRVRIALGLALDSVARAAGTNAWIASWKIARQRVASLHHEYGNHAVELHPVIERFVCELLKIPGRKRCLTRVELDDHGSLVCFDSCLLHTSLDGHRSFSTHSAHLGRRATQTRRP